MLAVYFGSVGIEKTRYAVTCGLIADVAGAIVAIWLICFFIEKQLLKVTYKSLSK